MALLVLIVLSLISPLCVGAEYQEAIIQLTKQVKFLNDELRQVKRDIPRIEDKLYNSMELSKLAFRTELTRQILPGLIESQVQTSLMDLLQGKSLGDIMGQRVTSEIMEVKVRQGQMKAQYLEMHREVSQWRKGGIKSMQDCASKTELKDLRDNVMSSLSDQMSVKKFDESSALLDTKYNSLKKSFKNVKRKLKTLENNYELFRQDAIGVGSQSTRNVWRGFVIRAMNNTFSKVSALERDNVDLKRKYKELEHVVKDKDSMMKTLEDRLLREALNQTSVVTGLHDGQNSTYFEKLIHLHLQTMNNSNDEIKEITDDQSRLKLGYNLLNQSVHNSERKIEALEIQDELMKRELALLNRIYNIKERSKERPRDAIKQSVRDPVRTKQKVQDVEYVDNVLTTNETRVKSKPVVRNNTDMISQQIQNNEKSISDLTSNVKYLFKKSNLWRSRLLLVPYDSNITKSFYQLTIEGDGLTILPDFNNTNNIKSVVFDSSTNSLFFSRFNPFGIYKLNLDGTSTYISALRNNTVSFGIAVDESRHLIFLTTAHWPNITVSRMNTDGSNFVTLLDLSKNMRYIPIGIAVDTYKRKIYITNGKNIFSLSYEGHHLTKEYTCSSGTSHVLTIDVGRSMLYFNDGRMIMRKSQMGGSGVMVAEMDHTPLNLKYYNNTVYVSSWDDGDIHILDVNTQGLRKIASVESPSLLCLLS